MTQPEIFMLRLMLKARYRTEADPSVRCVLLTEIHACNVALGEA